MSMRDEILKAVPVGADQKVPARTIWRRMGIGALASARGHLIALASEGLVERISEDLTRGPAGHCRHLYWREAA